MSPPTNMTSDAVLIENVQKHKCLYDFMSAEYNKKDYVDDVWKQIAVALDCTVQECKDKWKNIRAAYVRSLRRNTRPYYLSPFLEFLKPYIRKPDANKSYYSGHADDMETSKTSNIESEENSDINSDEFNDTYSSDTDETPMMKVKLEPNPIASYDSDDGSDSKLSKRIKTEKRLHPKKRKVLHKSKSYKTEIEPNNDESKVISDKEAMRYFLLSLLPEFDTMDASQMRVFKIKVLTLIDEIKNNPSIAREYFSVNN